ncbi:hypothetical protein HYE68_005262 [Fusarium pseudograminearum]|nr:hypothetical protein HYE68_005262 [Fusarium pseudograminearum]
MDNFSYFSNNNIAAVLIAPHAAFGFIATVFVVLRIYTARYITKHNWAFDEYISIVALIANHIMLISECISVSHGLGSNVTRVSNQYGTANFLKVRLYPAILFQDYDLMTQQQSILAIECAYGVACPLSKSAVLAMYYRIFKSSNIIRYSTYIIASMLAGWGIAVLLVSIFLCNPVDGRLEATITSKCINSRQYYVGITIPNIIFDIVTVVLPVREIWRLKMGRNEKRAITSIFLLGGLVVIASVARLVLFLIFLPGVPPTGNNISQTVIFPHAASAIETCLAIIGACLPPCGPLLKKMLKHAVAKVSSGSGNMDNKEPDNNSVVTIGKISNRGPGVSKKRTINDGLEGGSFEQLDDNQSLQGSTDELCTGMGHKKGSKSQIYVQREVRVESSEDRGYRNYDAEGIPLRDL